MKYNVVHNTTYSYTTPAEACHNALRLTPRTLAEQTCLGLALTIEPPPARVHDHIDFFGNQVHHFAVLEPHQKLSITSRACVSVERRPMKLEGSRPWDEVRGTLHRERDEATIGALQYTYDSPYIRASSALRGYAAKSFTPGRPIHEAAHDLMMRINKEFTYDPKATTIDTSLEVVLNRRRGVCQDFAHLQIGCLRSLGLAARYVSGYLRTQSSGDKPRLVGADASHAWLSVFCPEKGWLDLDPTNACIPCENHIMLAWGRDYHDVSPVKGIVLGAVGSTLTIAVDVAEVDETPKKMS
jgi:transglutaminase-like putative cysteine protease